MNTTLAVPKKDQKEKANFLLEIANTEKQLWVLIHSKELQDIEYSLWKLHYKHIDEFRKRTKRSSANSESMASAFPSGSDDKHIEGFKSFLLKATEFYKRLIVKIRSHYGLPEESSLYKRGGIASSVEPIKLLKCHFLCHRFLVCLGDLARYMEQFEKSSVQKHNWSVAATYYLEAAIIWPDSGNPQNQLAVLATYVGDEFLALYHCVRSLAVKEPFPDAWNNLILLFERNRSCHLHSLSSEAPLDFLKPAGRSDSLVKSQSSSNISEGEHDHSVETNFWPLLIRTLSFFFLKSSLEDFPCAFASTMRLLDMMMALDDRKLRALLESYQLMDSARTGPFRSLQAVSIFIFVFHNLINSPEIKDSKDGKNKQHLELIQLALAATFVFMGRLVYRCLKANVLDSCPLLPTVLVFMEWLVSKLDEVESYGADEKTKSSMSYFFAAFIDLLKQFNNKAEVWCIERTTLWEDYELRGFAPLAQVHASLDFSTNWDQIDSYECGIECRIKRITNAAMKIANRSNGSYKWIAYDSSGRKFYAKDTNTMPETPESVKIESTNFDIYVKEQHQNVHEATKECETRIASEAQCNHAVDGKSFAMEDEEVILFKPLARYNSAPLYGKINNGKDPASSNETEETVPSDECLRRATSLLIAQNQGHTSDFQSDISNFRRSKPFKQQEPFVKDTTAAFSFSDAPISAGPPSLNAWVLNRGSFSCSENGRVDVTRQALSPIDEMVATSTLSDLSIHETQNSVTSLISEASTNHYYSPPPYSVPAPSAPLLPDDATWFTGTQSSFSEVNCSGHIAKPDHFYEPSRLSGYPNWSPDRQLNYGSTIPGFMDKYPPFSGMSSSEWLRQYRESRNIDRANTYARPINYYAPGITTRNFPAPDASRFGLFDQYGVPSVSSNPTIYSESSILHPGFPLVYGMEEPRRDKLYHGYQRPSPYGCGAMTELRDEPQPLLQYLKEKEWLLQQDPTLRNPTYMGN
ncbi:hypothetical protein PTKIN_Ptkin18bG0122200 [Pterospermum kingtungense]